MLLDQVERFIRVNQPTFRIVDPSRLMAKNKTMHAENGVIDWARRRLSCIARI